MKKHSGFISYTTALFLCFAVHAAFAQTSSKVSLKEGTKEIFKFPGLDSVMVKDSKVATANKTNIEGELLIAGKNFGKTEMVCWNKEHKEFRVAITVVPRYWETLQALLEDQPQVEIDIMGGHIILSGEVLNTSALVSVTKASNLDPSRIINNVSLSSFSLAEKIKKFMKNHKYSTGVKVSEKTVFLSGQVFDKGRLEKLINVTKSLSEPYKFSINTTMLYIDGTDMLVNIKFVQIDKTEIRNLGIILGDLNITGTFDGTFSGNYKPNSSTSKTDPYNIRNTTHADLSATGRTEKRNQGAKIIHDTTLSTRSGETVKFQRGGTIHAFLKTDNSSQQYDIDYGFLVNATPKLINSKLIEAEVDISISALDPASNINNGDNVNITKYMTNSKYTLRPGESVIVNKLEQKNDDTTKQGIPFLSDIPYLNEIMGYDNVNNTESVIFMIMTIGLKQRSTDKDADKKYEEMKDKVIKVKRP